MLSVYNNYMLDNVEVVFRVIKTFHSNNNVKKPQK